MNEHDIDPVRHLLSRLPQAAPDALRAERTRARCRELGARRSRSEARRRERRRAMRRMLEPALVAGFSLTYVIALVHTLLRWHGVL